MKPHRAQRLLAPVYAYALLIGGEAGAQCFNSMASCTESGSSDGLSVTRTSSGGNAIVGTVTSNGSIGVQGVVTGTTTTGSAGVQALSSSAGSAAIDSVNSAVNGTALLGACTATTGAGTCIVGQSSAASGSAVVGQATGSGLYSIGVSGTSANGNGVQGEALTGNTDGVGVKGLAHNASYAVYGLNDGSGLGVYGLSTNSTSGIGVLGSTNGVTSAAGVYGSSNSAGPFGSSTGNGVEGHTVSPLGFGVAGFSTASGSTANSAGVFAKGTTQMIGGTPQVPALRVDTGNAWFTAANASPTQPYYTTLTPSNIVKAWANVTITAPSGYGGLGTAIVNDGFNISSVNYSCAVGGYVTIYFASFFNSAHYAVFYFDESNSPVAISGKTNNSINIGSSACYYGGALTSDTFSLMAIGNQ